MKKYGEPPKLKMAGAASLQRENNNSELGMSKKYPREAADPTEWLTGSLAHKEPRKSKLEQYNLEADLEYKGLTKAPSTRKLETVDGHNQSQGHIPSIL